MTTNEKRVAEREALRSVIQQWNANRLDLFELSEPDEASVECFSFLCKQYRWIVWTSLTICVQLTHALFVYL